MPLNWIPGSQDWLEEQRRRKRKQGAEAAAAAAARSGDGGVIRQAVHEAMPDLIRAQQNRAAIQSLRSETPDTETLKPLAETAKKIAKMYSQKTGGRALLPDIHLALTMSGLSLPAMEALLDFSPESMAQEMAEGEDKQGFIKQRFPQGGGYGSDLPMGDIPQKNLTPAEKTMRWALLDQLGIPRRIPANEVALYLQRLPHSYTEFIWQKNIAKRLEHNVAGKTYDPAVDKIMQDRAIAEGMNRESIVFPQSEAARTFNTQKNYEKNWRMVPEDIPYRWQKPFDPTQPPKVRNRSFDESLRSGMPIPAQADLMRIGDVLNRFWFWFGEQDSTRGIRTTPIPSLDPSVFDGFIKTLPPAEQPQAQNILGVLPNIIQTAVEREKAEPDLFKGAEAEGKIAVSPIESLPPLVKEPEEEPWRPLAFVEAQKEINRIEAETVRDEPSTLGNEPFQEAVKPQAAAAMRANDEQRDETLAEYDAIAAMAGQGSEQAAALLEELGGKGISRESLVRDFDEAETSISTFAYGYMGDIALENLKSRLDELVGGDVQGQLMGGDPRAGQIVDYQGVNPDTGEPVERTPAGLEAIPYEERYIPGRGYARVRIGSDRPDPLTDPEGFLRSQQYWWEQRNQKFFADSTQVVLDNIRDYGDERTGGRILTFQEMVNRQYKDMRPTVNGQANPNFGKPRFPVSESGSIDDPSVQYSMLALSYERAVAAAALFPDDVEDPDDTHDRALRYIDSFMDYVQTDQNDYLNLQAARQSGDPVRQHWAEFYSAMKVVSTDYKNMREDPQQSWASIRLLNPQVAEAEDRMNRAELYRTMYPEVMALRDSGVTETEFTYWWTRNLGSGKQGLKAEEVVPESAKTMLVGWGDVASKYVDDAVGGIAEAVPIVSETLKRASPPYLMFSAAPKPVQDAVMFTADTIAESLNRVYNYKPPALEIGGVGAELPSAAEITGATGEAVGEATSEYLEKGAKPFLEAGVWAIDKSLEIPGRALIAAHLYFGARYETLDKPWGESYPEEIAEDRLTAGQMREFNAGNNPFTHRPRSEDPMTDIADFAVSWVDAWEKSQELYEEKKTLPYLFFKDVGVDMESPEGAALQLSADLYLELKELQAVGAGLKMVKQGMAAPLAARALRASGLAQPTYRYGAKLVSDALAEGAVSKRAEDVKAAAENVKRLQGDIAAREAAVTTIEEERGALRSTLGKVSQEAKVAEEAGEDAGALAGQAASLRQRESQVERTLQKLKNEAQNLRGTLTDAEAASLAAEDNLLLHSGRYGLGGGRLSQAFPELGYFHNLRENLRFADTPEKWLATIARYETENPGANMSFLIEDNLAAMTRQIRNRVVASGTTERLPHWMRRYTKSFSVEGGNRAYSDGNLFVKLEDNGLAAGFDNKTITGYLDDMHDYILGGATPEWAYTRLIADMDLQQAIAAAVKHHGSEKEAVRVVENILRTKGLTPEQWEAETSYITTRLLTGGRGTPEYEAALDAIQQRQLERLRALARSGDVMGSKLTTAAASIAESEIDELVDAHMKQYMAHLEDWGLAVDDAGMAAVRDTYRGLLAEQFSRVPQVTGKSGELEQFIGERSRVRSLLEDYTGYMRTHGLAPHQEEELLGLMARNTVLEWATRGGEWWANADEVGLIAKQLGGKSKEVAQATQQLKYLRRAELELGKASELPLLPFQVRPYTTTLLPELTAYLHWGPNSLPEIINRLTAADKWMTLWRPLALSGFGTQIRMMSDEGLRLVDQGIGWDAILGIGKYKDIYRPWHITQKGSAFRNLMNSFEPKSFEVFGGPGREYSEKQFNWWMHNLTSGPTRSITKTWFTGERKRADNGYAALKDFFLDEENLSKFLEEPGMREILEPSAIKRATALINRGGEDAAETLARSLHEMFKYDMRLYDDLTMRGLYKSFMSNAKYEVSANEWWGVPLQWMGSPTGISQKLKEGGANLPIIVGPRTFYAENRLAHAGKAAQGVVDKVSGWMFTPLEVMVRAARSGSYRKSFNERFNTIIPDITKADALTIRMAEQAAARYASQMTDNIMYRGFRTAWEHKMRNLFPFAAAWRNYLQYWTKAMVMRPSRFALFAKAQQLPGEYDASDFFNRIGLDSIAPAFSMFKLNPRSAMFFTGGVAGSGVPAVGPIVTVPAAQLQKWDYDTFGFISDVPGFAFTNPNSPQFAKYDKLLWSLTGKLGVPADSSFRHLPYPLGFREESYDKKVDYELKWLGAEFSRLTGKIPTQEKLDELRKQAEDRVESHLMMESLGQYALPTGLSVRPLGQQLGSAIDAVRRSDMKDRDLWRRFFLGELPQEALPEGAEDFSYYYDPLDPRVRELFRAVMRYDDAPTKSIPGSGQESKETMLQGHFAKGNYSVIPYIIRSTEYDPDTREYKPLKPDELKQGMREKTTRVLSGEFGGEWPSMAEQREGGYAIDPAKDGYYFLGGRSGREKLDELENIQNTSPEISRSWDGKTANPRYRLNGQNLQDLIDNLKSAPGKVSEEYYEAQEKTAALASRYTGYDALNIMGLPDTAFRAGAAEKGQGEIDKVIADAIQIPESERTDAQDIAAGKPRAQVDAENQIWSQAWTAYAAIEAQMKTEQGETVDFHEKKGYNYALLLDAKIAQLGEAGGEDWMRRWYDSHGPKWVQLRNASYGLDDPESGTAWQAAYGYLKEMTDRMAQFTGSKQSAERKAIQAEYLAKIEELKAQNEKFAKQVGMFDKNTFKPALHQLKRWGGNTMSVRSGGSGRGRRRGVRRGKRGGKARGGKSGGKKKRYRSKTSFGVKLRRI